MSVQFETYDKILIYQDYCANANLPFGMNGSGDIEVHRKILVKSYKVSEAIINLLEEIL